MGGVVEAVGDAFESAADFAKDTVKTVGHFAQNTLKGDFKELWSDFRDDIKDVGGSLANMARSQFDLLGEISAAPFDMVGLDSVRDFTRNVFSGVGNNFGLMIEGITEGKWSKFRDALIGTVTTALYLAAIVFSGGNPYVIAAAVIALDGQHNNGMLTKSAVNLLSKIETALTGTSYLQKYADEITTALVIVSSLYAGAVGGNALLKLTNIGSLNTLLDYYKTAIGTYGIYDSVQQFEEFREYYKGLLDEYMAWAQQMQQAYAQTKAQWFEMYANLDNGDVCYESMAGGYLFNAGAGSDEYSPSSIHEQGAYALVIDTRRDIDLDRTIFFNSEVDHVDLRLEYYKEPITKWI